MQSFVTRIGCGAFWGVLHVGVMALSGTMDS